MGDKPHPFASVSERLLGNGEGSAAEARLAREKILKPTDGRTLRSKGKSVTVNYRVTPQFKRDLFELAQAESLTMTDILERALEVYKHTRRSQK